MIIFVDQLTPRVQYAFDNLFRDFNFDLNYTTEEADFLDYSGPKIIYSKKRKSFSHDLHIGSSGILDHTDFVRVKTDPGSWKGLPTLFSVKEGDLPFDIAAAVFFMLSRYEEYWRFEADSLGRFKPESSVSMQIECIERPIVDEWIRVFESHLRKIFPTLELTPPQAKFISTIDVDSAYAYRHKGMYRTVGGFLKDLSRFEFKNFYRRFRCLSGIIDDPYDTYSYIHQQHQQRKVDSIFFFLLADFSAYDKGLPYSSKGLRKLISSVSKVTTVGIHPGVESHKRYNTMLREKSRLEGIIARQVKHSRQHYLMLKFRTTYRLLKSTGISHDYSMGFAHAAGFRAGTCRPFYWFDLKKNQASSLTIHPLVAMDTTLNKYMGLSIPDAKQKISELASLIRAYNGEFISLWHNETLANEKDWLGWREVFEHTLDVGSQFSSDV